MGPFKPMGPLHPTGSLKSMGPRSLSPCPPSRRPLFLPPIQNPRNVYALNHVQYAYQISVVACSFCWRTFTSGVSQHCKGAKQQNLRCIASSLKFLRYGSMEWNMEENFTMEWNMEWKIFSIKWKWNGRKLSVWNMEKSSSISYHALPMMCGSNKMVPRRIPLDVYS